MQPRRTTRRGSTPIAATSLAFAIAVMSFLTAEPDARAQSAQAEALFQDGNRLMAQGKIAQACDAFAASNRLEPGAGVLLNLGDCRAQNGQLASAWAAYKAALNRAKTPKKRVDAEAKIAAIAPRISYLTVSVSDDSRLDGLSLTSNGEPLDPMQWNQALPVDGGDYVIAGTAPGQASWQVVAHVPVEGGNVTVAVPRFRPTTPPASSAVRAPRGARVSATAPKLDDQREPGSPAALPPALAATSPAPLAEPSGHEPARSTGTFTTTRNIAIGVAGASAIGVVAGAALGVSAKRKQNDAFDRCPDPKTPCPRASEAQALIESGRRQALEANIALGIAAAAAVGAGILWFTGAPDGERPRRISVVPSVAPGETGIAVMGRF
jgi:hypothetical protein